MADRGKFPLGLLLIGLAVVFVVAIGGGLTVKNLAKGLTTTVN
jgi:hypothetical protein